MRLRKKCRNIKKKFFAASGETIAETLVTMVILSLAVLMIAGAVVSAAKVNKKADNTQTAFSATDVKDSTAQNIVITEVNEDGTAVPGGDSTEITVNMYETDNDYLYYEIPGQQS